VDTGWRQEDRVDDTQADVTEIADGIYRISTFVAGITPTGFTFNQFLLTGDDPLLFHAGHRRMFGVIAEAVARVVPVESLRWISFGHVEADECGAMNQWLTAAPASEVAFGALGCSLSLDDLCDRPPRVLAEGEVLDLGGKRVRQISTPHVPHGWEAQVLYEETSGTLLCSDLLTHAAGGPALTTDDVVGPALEAEAAFHAMTMAPHTGEVLRSLGDLEPTTLAIMHGSSFQGDGRQALHDLAAGLETMAAGNA
jgi:flavorubredoxin